MGNEGERLGEKYQYKRKTLISYLSYAPNQGPCLQPRHMSLTGTEPET